jgi:hypothetical protein
MTSNENDVNIEDEALSVIRKYAEEREISLGQAASDLVHRGAGEPSPVQDKERLGRFRTSPGIVANQQRNA